MKSYRSLLLSISILLCAQTSLAQDCELAITGNDSMQFDLAELTVPSSCEMVTLTLSHIGELPAVAMGHNWVLSETDDMQAVASDGISAGIDKRYLKENDTRVLASTPVIGGGDETSVTFSISALTAGKEYAYFCSFPGHWALMKGIFKVTE